MIGRSGPFRRLTDASLFRQTTRQSPSARTLAAAGRDDRATAGGDAPRHGEGVGAGEGDRLGRRGVRTALTAPPEGGQIESRHPARGEERRRRVDRTAERLVEGEPLDERHGEGGREPVAGAAGVDLADHGCRHVRGDRGRVVRDEHGSARPEGDGDARDVPVAAERRPRDSGRGDVVHLAAVESLRLALVRGDDRAAGHGSRAAGVRVPDHRHATSGRGPQGVAERLHRGDPAAVVGHDDRVGVEHRLEHLVGDRRRGDGAAVVVDAGDRVPALGPDPGLGRRAGAERARDDGHVAQCGPELVGAAVVRQSRDEGDLDAVEGEHRGDQPGAAGAPAA
jgi:hypothetical protein